MTDRSQDIPTRTVEHGIGRPIATDIPQLKPTERTDNQPEEDEQ